MKKIVVTCFWDLSPVVENALETAMHFSDLGYQVSVFDGASVVSFREINKSNAVCAKFRFLRPLVKGMQIARKFHKISWQKLDGFEHFESLAVGGEDTLWEVQSFEAASRVKIDDFDVGAAALSSLIHVVNEVPDQDVKFKRVLPLWINIVKSGIEIYKYFEKVFEDPNIEVAAFNGRFVNDAAIIAAAKKKNRVWWLYENGPVGCEFFKLVQFPTHSIKHHRARIADMSARRAKAELEGEGGAFFTNLAGDRSFNPHMAAFDDELSIQSLGTENIGEAVVFFQTSDDEYFSLPDGVGEEYKGDWYDQRELVRYLAERRTDLKFLVRLHPHMKEKAPSYQKSWLQGDWPTNVEIISYDSPLSSYELLELAGPVIVTQSTIGLEAINRGKPVIVAGATIWSHIDGAYEARSRAQVLRLIESYSELEVKSRYDALVCGAYIASAWEGVPYRLTKRTGQISALFDGNDLFKV